MITMSDNSVRILRSLLKQALDLIPDPDKPVHARGDDPRGLCKRGGKSPRLTDQPAQVTCGSCKTTLAWEPWAYRRDDGDRR